MTYKQPFYVGQNNPRFPYARGGYLPALEESEEVLPVVKTYFSRRDRKVIDELKSEVLHYRQDIAEYMAKVDKLTASKKGKTTDYDVDDIVTSVTNRHDIVTDRHK